MKFFTRLFLLSTFVLTTGLIKAQISGAFTIPGSFPTLAAAINTLNIVGVAGPVTINVAAGYTETAPAGGYKLFNPAGGSVTNQVTFQKSGAGANPLITAFTGTANPSSIVQDGVWWFIGADNITIDGIDIYDPNTTNPASMEFGYGFYKTATPYNGCQNNTIKNCSITLSRNNGLASSYTPYFASGSRGIDVSGAPYNANTTATNAGPNSFNRFYSNRIQNCHVGISIMSTIPITVLAIDEQNDVGGLSAVTGNTITNFGGANNSSCYGVFTANQYSVNISYNVFENNNGSGSNPVTDLTAIKTGTTLTSNVTIKSNTITLSSTATSAIDMDGINNYAGGGSSGQGTVTVSGNVFPSYNYPASNGISSNFINEVSGVPNSNISNNRISNVTLNNATINFISAVGNTITANSNTVTNVSCNSLLGHVIMINANYNVTASNNLLSNFNCTTTGDFDCILLNVDKLVMSNNEISNMKGTRITGLNSSTSIGGLTRTITGNTLKNFSSSAAITGLNFVGFDVFGNTTTTVNVSANTIYSVTSSGSSTSTSYGNLTGVRYNTLGKITMNGNKIYSMYSTGAGTVQGVALSTGTPTITNNIIGDLQITGSNQAVSVRGITTFATYCNASIAYNTIYLNNPGSGTNSGSTALYFDANNTFTLNNNIMVNTSTPTGTGLTTVIRRANVSPYSALSNTNLLYAGTPATNRLIYYDGTNSYGPLYSFKYSINPAEQQSVTENPPFITTNGSLANVLSLDPAIATQAEGSAIPFAGVTTDYAGNARSATTPDIGAWEGNYIKADSYKPVLLASGFLTDACTSTSARTMTVSLKDSSGIASGTYAPRLYYRVNFGLYSSVQGLLSTGTATNGTWSFNMTYAASSGDVISYFLAAQDISPAANLLISPSTGVYAGDVNTILIPPAPANSYTLQTYPTISVNSGNLCSGRSFTMSPTGASTYSYSSGSAIVSPTTTTSYSVTGYSSSGCASTNTAVSTVSVIPSPVISVNSGSTCAGQSFTLVPTGATSYTYSGGSAVVTPTVTSSYSVTGTNSNGCVSNVAVATVTAISAGIVAHAVTPAVCAGNSTTLYGSGGSGYTWSGGVTDNTPFSPATTKVYTVTGTGANGCPGTSTVQVTVNVLPSVSISAPHNIICFDDVLTLTANGATSYTWSPGGSNASQIVVTPTATTSYSVTGRNANGCVKVASTVITVNLCTGIETYDSGQNVLIYPNPSSGKIRIDVPSSDTYNVKIFNAISQLVYDAQGYTGSSTIDFTSTPGIYFISIYNQDKVIATRKVVVN